MTPYLSTDRVTLYHARAEDVYPHLEPGFSLVVMDGPYAMGIADWDCMKVADLPEWYRPHLEAVTRLAAPSASLYLWNTAEGWARLDPVVRACGWDWRVNVVWDKRTPPSMLGWRSIQVWPDQTETCALYSRGRPHFRLDACTGNVWEYSVKRLSLEQTKAPDKAEHRGNEGSVYPSAHPTQKPLLFADRIIRASSRPGDRVLVPFGGTSREAVACHRLPREEARHVVSIEMDARYLDAVRGCFALDTTPKDPRQGALFGGGE